jgi:hypothetical protein
MRHSRPLSAAASRRHPRHPIPEERYAHPSPFHGTRPDATRSYRGHPSRRGHRRHPPGPGTVRRLRLAWIADAADFSRHSWSAGRATRYGCRSSSPGGLNARITRGSTAGTPVRGRTKKGGVPIACAPTRTLHRSDSAAVESQPGHPSSRTNRGSGGFAMYPSHPAPVARSRSSDMACAVSAMSTIPAVCGSALRMRFAS